MSEGLADAVGQITVSTLGATTGFFLQMSVGDLSVGSSITIITVSVLFGVITPKGGRNPLQVKRLLNAGAIWLLAALCAAEFARSVIQLAGIAFGVGLAGEQALIVFERGILALVKRFGDFLGLKDPDPNQDQDS